MKDKRINREHGYGGKKTRELITDIILPEISNPYAEELDDSAVLPPIKNPLVFTTDSFVVTPPFFPGGDTGKLAVSGTVNDILAQAGEPRYLSMTLILEEGFGIDELKKIARSAAEEARKAGVEIVCGDIKVVEEGSGDGVYATASGIGEEIFKPRRTAIKTGDVLIVTGSVGEHGAAVFQARNKLLKENAVIKSDCDSLTGLLDIFRKHGEHIKFMRDPTRGGLAEVIIELAGDSKIEINIEEENIPVADWVRGLCHIAGLDYLYLACEGRMVLVVDGSKAENILSSLKNTGFPDACIIGRIGGKGKAVPVLNTISGGQRILNPADIVQIPRIC